MDQLKEHPQIVELLDTLDKNGLMKEKNEVQSLVSYIGGMEETLTERQQKRKRSPLSGRSLKQRKNRHRRNRQNRKHRIWKGADA